MRGARNGPRRSRLVGVGGFWDGGFDASPQWAFAGSQRWPPAGRARRGSGGLERAGHRPARDGGAPGALGRLDDRPARGLPPRRSADAGVRGARHRGGDAAGATDRGPHRGRRRRDRPDGNRLSRALLQDVRGADRGWVAPGGAVRLPADARARPGVRAPSPPDCHGARAAGARRRRGRGRRDRLGSADPRRNRLTLAFAVVVLGIALALARRRALPALAIAIFAVAAIAFHELLGAWTSRFATAGTGCARSRPSP